MKSINSSLEPFLLKQEHQITLEKKMDEIFTHPRLIQWWQNHPEWSREDLGRFFIKLKQYIQEAENCRSCKGLDQCSNVMKGHSSQLFSYGTMIDLDYSPCSYQDKAQQENQRSKLIRSHHIPKDILQGNFRDFDQSNDERIDAFNAVLQFCLGADPGNSGIGLYLYGSLGVGKSYLLGAACNELARRGIASYMVYTPDFFREMKGAIAEQKVEEKLQGLKEIPVLIFDDIGAENISAWARDEVLGTILQYRVTEKLPTLYTSNYSYTELEEHLAYSQKGGIEQLKAKRLMERIRHYTDSYFVGGGNRRVRK
jgi:primosomal protein DnaI